MKGIIAIPARLKSTRLPRKLLLADTGKPLIAHVIENCLEAVKSNSCLTDVVLACDDDEFFSVAEDYDIRVYQSIKYHESGTSRIAEAVENLDIDCDFVINVQADEPEVRSQVIEGVASNLLRNPSDEMATAAVRRFGRSPDFDDPNYVKIVIDSQGRAIYFSRSPVPYRRDLISIWYQHVGVYGYRRDCLSAYRRLRRSELEMQECLEQLRALEENWTIRVHLIPIHLVGKGVDTREDYDAFVQRFKANVHDE